MRFTVGEIIRATVVLAGLLIIVEHAGGFSKVLSSGATSYATVFNAVSGHGGIASGRVSSTRDMTRG